MTATVRIDCPTHALHGRVFENARRETLEIRAGGAIQHKESERRWRARPSGSPGWLAIDCFIVDTEHGPIGLPVAVCKQVPEEPPCPSA